MTQAWNSILHELSIIWYFSMGKIVAKVLIKIGHTEYDQQVENNTLLEEKKKRPVRKKTALGVIRVTAVAQVPSLAQEIPHATGVAKKKKKPKKKKKRKNCIMLTFEDKGA